MSKVKFNIRVKDAQSGSYFEPNSIHDIIDPNRIKIIIDNKWGYLVEKNSVIEEPIGQLNVKEEEVSTPTPKRGRPKQVQE